MYNLVLASDIIIIIYSLLHVKIKERRSLLIVSMTNLKIEWAFELAVGCLRQLMPVTSKCFMKMKMLLV
jgi:hypothetical protein